MSSMNDLSAKACRFLLQIGEAGIVAFNPRGDELIVALLDGGMIDAERVDGETALLRLTPKAIPSLLGCATTWLIVG